MLYQEQVLFVKYDIWVLILPTQFLVKSRKVAKIQEFHIVFSHFNLLILSGVYVDVAPHAAKVTEVLKYDRLTLHGLAVWKQSEFDITSYSLFVCMIKMLHRTWCSTEHT